MREPRQTSRSRYNFSMQRVSRIVFVCGCVAALFAFLPAAAAARAPQGSPLPASTAPATPATTIVLPQKLLAGSRATLAVLDANGRLVAGVAVELSGFGEVKTDSTGRAMFVVPSGATALYADLRTGGAPTMAPIASEIAHVAAIAASVAKIADAPSVIALGETFDIGGAGFNGDASQDRVATGDLPALILAASPSSIVALPNPGAVLGDAKLAVTVQNQQIGVRPVTVVSLDLLGPSNPFAPGATSSFTVRVAGSTKPVLVQVYNATPDVVDLPGGNIRRLVTSGGASNSAPVPVASIRPGDYSVSVRLIPVVQGVSDTETARLELTDARGTADAKWLNNLSGILALMGRQPNDLARVRQEIAKRLRQHPPARIADSLPESLCNCSPPAKSYAKKYCHSERSEESLFCLFVVRQ